MGLGWALELCGEGQFNPACTVPGFCVRNLNFSTECRLKANAFYMKVPDCILVGRHWNCPIPLLTVWLVSLFTAARPQASNVALEWCQYRSQFCEAWWPTCKLKEMRVKVELPSTKEDLPGHNMERCNLSWIWLRINHWADCAEAFNW